MPDKDEFFNSVYNNWNAYGLVTKVPVTDGFHLDIKKKHYGDDGESDPQEIYDLIQKDIEYERFLHLRHTTAGANTAENCQPIDVYYDEKSGNQIVFMHNGTFMSFVPKKLNGQKWEDDNEGKSDTVNFVEKVLQPFIPAMNFGTGKGDIQHPLFKLWFHKFWPDTSRGILISSKYDSITQGSWDKIKCDKTGQDIAVSNDTYFKNVTRGPEFMRREEARRRFWEESNKQKEAEKGVQKKVSEMTELYSFQDFKFGKRNLELDEPLADLLSENMFWDREHATMLGYATWDEFWELTGDRSTCATIFSYVAEDYLQCHQELMETQTKHEKASKLIAELKGEIMNLQNELKLAQEGKSSKKTSRRDFDSEAGKVA